MMDYIFNLNTIIHYNVILIHTNFLIDKHNIIIISKKCQKQDIFSWVEQIYEIMQVAFFINYGLL